MKNFVGVILVCLILVDRLPQTWTAIDLESEHFKETLSSLIKFQRIAAFQQLARPRTVDKYPHATEFLPEDLHIPRITGSGNACTNDLVRISLNLDEDWAQRMLDADGKPSSGMLDGNFYWPGDYYECRHIHVPPSNNSGSFTGRYCMLSWTIILNSTWAIPLTNDVCVPSTCDATDITNLTNIALLTNRTPLKQVAPAFFNVTRVSASCRIQKQSFDGAAIGTTFVLVVFASLLLAGTGLTVAERFKESHSTSEPSMSYAPLDEDGKNVQLIKESKESELKKFFKCFSVLTNGSKILSTDRTGDLSCIHGIRFLSMTWVILGHTYAFALMSRITGNIKELRDQIDNLPFQAIMQGTFSVDSFFLLSGFLLSYLFLKEANSKNGKISWPLFYFHRLWRLTPVYAVVLAFDTSLTVFMADGPFWPNESSDPNCRETWWWNLLYINNFVDQTKSCMGWSWYLANDMQFYVISPIFLYVLWRRPKIGLSVISVLLISSWVAAGIISYHYDLLPGYATLTDAENMADIQQKMGEYFQKIYIKPYTRIGPYLIGVILGYIISYRTAENKKSLPKLAQCFGWVLATSAGLGLIYGFYHSHPGPVVTLFYNALSRSVFSATLAWVIFACLEGNAGLIDVILSAKILIPLSRLTYCAYLVHPIIVIGFFQSLSAPIHVTHIHMVALFLGFLALSYATALVTSLAFESPLMAFEKQVLALLRNRRSL